MDEKEGEKGRNDREEECDKEPELELSICVRGQLSGRQLVDD